MIIKCPSCGRRFQLNRRPPQFFKCPKCHYTTSFEEIFDNQDEEQRKEEVNDIPPVSSVVPGTTPGMVNGAATHVVENQQYGETQVVNIPNQYQKTKVVDMPKTRGILQVMYKGVNFGTVTLPPSGGFTLGRRSSDSNATIKLTPDMTMSRLHAGMRTRQQANGQVMYQITSVKSDNPVIVNGKPVPKSAICNLKNGDVIVMGETTVLFKMI